MPIPRYASTRLRVADVVCLVYVLAMALFVVLFGRSLEDWPMRVGLHLALAVVVLEVARAGERRGPGLSVAWFLRCAYPLGIMLHAWGELNAFVPLLWGSYWGTVPTVQADLLLFGTYPTAWFQQWHRDWLDELMAVFYVSYYVFLTVPAVVLVSGRYLAASVAGSVIALNYLTNFAFYLVFPSKGPAHSGLEFPDLTAGGYGGYLAAGFLQALQDAEAVVGAAFPSSHVSGSTVCTLLALRFVPAMGRVLLPLGLGMTVATVYLGYHHAVDPIGGVIWGAVCYGLGMRWVRVRGEDAA